MPKVYNTRHKDYPKDAVYIGRPSKWGNPYRVGKDISQEEAVELYRIYLSNSPKLAEAAKKELAGKDLRCWCKPLACHGDVLLEVANA